MASSFAGRGQKAFADGPAPAPTVRARLDALLEPERDRWLLFVPVAFGLGIALWFWLPFVAQRQAAVLAGLAIALAGLGLGGPGLSGPGLSGLGPGGLARRIVLGAGLLIAAGVVTADVRSALVAEPRLHHRLTADEIRGTVEAVDVRDGGARRVLLLRRDASSVDPAIRVRLTFAGALPGTVRPGARIAVDAVLGPLPGPVLPGAYNPARRAWFEGISATGRATGMPRILAPAPPGNAWLANRRADLAAFLPEQLGPDAGAVAVALVIGEQGQVAPDLLEAMRVSGLAHLLTVSGFHITVVVGGAFVMMRRLLALWPWLALRVSVSRVAALVAGFAGTGYALLSGGDVPAVRAAITAWIVLVALMLGRDPVSLRLLAFAAMAILLLRPEALLNPSFQLSFAAVTSLVLLAQSDFGQRIFLRTPEDGWLVRAGRVVAAMLMTGLVAELVLTPIALAHFGRAGVYGVFANLVAIPLTSFVIMPLLALFLLLSVAGLGSIASWALVPALDALAGVATGVAAWPGAKFAVPAVPLAAFALVVSGMVLAGLLAGRLRWLGVPMLVLGIGWALLAPRPDLFITGDGRQVGIVADGRLFTLRGHRGGFVPSMWAESAVAAADGRFADLPGARCNAAGCALEVDGSLALLALTGEQVAPGALAVACAAADIVTSPEPLPAGCAPRWLQLDRAALRETGAVAIHARSRRLDSVAARAGDHVWSPSALPGERPRLLGEPAWTGVVTE